MLPKPILAPLKAGAWLMESLAWPGTEFECDVAHPHERMARRPVEQDFSSVVLRLSTEKYSILSGIIRWRTDFPISHAEYWFPKTGWTLGARFPDGIQWRGPESTKKQSNVMLFTFEGIDRAAKWMADNRVGFRYDTLGIFGIATARDWHDKDQRFCSEGIEESSEQRFLNMRLPLLADVVARWQITPRDLTLSTGLRRVE